MSGDRNRFSLGDLVSPFGFAYTWIDPSINGLVIGGLISLGLFAAGRGLQAILRRRPG
jgi:hypothetical protein